VSIGWLLPRTESVSLRYVVVISCAAFVALAVQLFFAFTQARGFFQPVLAPLLLVESYFLWQLHSRALVIARWLWALVVVLLVFGCLLNPFFW